jgi:hypothetical protein
VLLLQGKRMHLATLWLGICGLALMTMLASRKIKGSIMYGACRSVGCLLLLSQSMQQGTGNQHSLIGFEHSAHRQSTSSNQLIQHSASGSQQRCEVQLPIMPVQSCVKDACVLEVLMIEPTEQLCLRACDRPSLWLAAALMRFNLGRSSKCSEANAPCSTGQAESMSATQEYHCALCSD